jgi:hypothetical protein
MARTIEPDERREISGEKWQTLPALIRAAFDCAGHVSMHQSLQVLGVDADPSGRVEWAYASSRGPLVVPVWHDQIECEPDGRLAYWIDTYEWQLAPESRPTAHVTGLRSLLTRHLGTDVYVLLLKRGWDANDAQVAERTATDIVMWRLEAAGQDWFVIRRPTGSRQVS